MRDLFENIMSYSIENKKVFEELSALCINGKVVPYVGSGLSAFAGKIENFKGLFPTWWSFLNPLYFECFEENIPDTISFIDAADKIEERLGKEIFYSKVQTSMGGKIEDWSEIIEKSKNAAVSILPNLFLGPIITTNFDQVLEHVHEDIPNFYVALPREQDLEKIEQAKHNRKRLLYKIHGCVSDVENIIFTKTKYNEAYKPDTELVKSLQTLFQSYYFLFLGCGLGVTNGTIDEPINVWKKLQEKGKSGMRHFAILPCNEKNLKNRRNELENQNIYPIFYNSEIDTKHESVKIILNKILNIPLDENKNRKFNIPTYDFDYIEREDSVIEKIKSKLIDNDFSICAITGFGGVGKTRIMSEYAREIEKTYTKVFWLNALSAEVVREEIRKFIVQFNKFPIKEYDKEKIETSFIEWTKNNDNYLFLLDNVEHYDDIKLFFKDANFTQKGKRHIILTSRPENELPNIQPIELDSFTPYESLRFLELYAQQTTDNFAEEIAKLLDGLPLALEQVAAYIRETNKPDNKYSYKEYFEELGGSDIIATLEKGRLSHTESVAATYNISIQRIKTKAAKELLNLCAFFAPDNIHSQWFIDAKDVLSEELQKNILTNFEEIKKDLKAYSLVRIDNEDRISLHRLLQEIIIKTIKHEQGKWVDDCVKIMIALKITDFDTSKARNDFSAMTLHMESLFKHCKKETEDISNLYHFYMFGLDKQKKHIEALKYEDKTLELRNNVYGKNEKETASTYNLVGVIYYNHGKYDKAFPYLDKALEIRKEIYNVAKTEENDLYVARTYNNIGIFYFYVGDYQSALNYYNEALKIKEKYKDYKDTAFTYNNTGANYDSISHDANNKALYYHFKALSIREKEYGIENVNTAFTYNNIGVIYKNQGNYHDALIYLHKSLKTREKLYKSEPEHPEIAQTCTNLADIYINKENYPTALNLLQRAIKIYEKTLPNTIDISKTYYNMAKYFYNQDDYKNALEWFVKVLFIRKKVLTEKHFSTQEVKGILENTYNKTNNSIPFEEWLREQIRKENDKNK